MDISKLRNLERGEDVTVITTGAFQLVDVGSGIKFPPLTEVKTPLTPFVENQLRLKNLTLSDESDAPKAKGEAKNVDDLHYEGEATLDKSLRENPVESRDDNSSTGNEAFTSSRSSRRKAASENAE